MHEMRATDYSCDSSIPRRKARVYRARRTRMTDLQIRPLHRDDLDSVSGIESGITGHSRKGFLEKRFAAAVESPAGFVVMRGGAGREGRRIRDRQDPGGGIRRPGRRGGPRRRRDRPRRPADGDREGGAVRTGAEDEGAGDRDAPDPGRLGDSRDDPLLLLGGIPPRPRPGSRAGHLPVARGDPGDRERGSGCRSQAPPARTTTRHCPVTASRSVR